MLLASSGSPTHPLSKFIQLCLAHLSKRLPYQLIDTKAFINKIELMNKHLPPLNTNCILVSCDVEKLYPSVDNSMGIPAVKNMLEIYPSPLCRNINCIIDGLEIVLNNNVCKFTKIDGSTIFALPNNGTAMSPCHAPDYVDVFMGLLDQKLVEECPVNLITSIFNDSMLSDQLKFLNWSRYRDGGFIILPNKEDLIKFQEFLMKLCPNKIKWTVESGRSINFLDVTVFINDNGKLCTDVYSKNCHSYLSPNSCHNPCTFRGLAVGMGRRLRLICSDDNTLKNRIIEYTNYLVSSGWNKAFAFKALTIGANVPRNSCLRKRSTYTENKIAWVTVYDPRVPNKTKIIMNNLNLLHDNSINKEIFPKKILISADRRRKNIGEIYKPSIPRMNKTTSTNIDNGFKKCNSRCDFCNHSENSKYIVSCYNKKKWYINCSLTCTTPNTIYIVKCKIHVEFLYVGSTTNLKKRWANHKSDSKNKKSNKCYVAKHYNENVHPNDDCNSLIIIPIEAVKNICNLGERELFWQANLWTFQSGGNSRSDIARICKNRIQYQI